MCNSQRNINTMAAAPGNTKRAANASSSTEVDDDDVVKFNALAIEEALSSTQTNQNEEQERKQQLRKTRLATNKKMVKKYQSMYKKIPTMTSSELVERWKQIDRQEDERDDSENSKDGNEDDGDEDDNDYGESKSSASSSDSPPVGPLLLIDVRSKEERAVSMIQGAVSMDDLETTKWINRNVHNFNGVADSIYPAIPTIVCYCTIGYRSGREAQRLVDDLTATFGDVQIGTSVEILNLDGILSYSFLTDAPPLMCTSMDAGSDYVMTRRVHSYGKEWSHAADPDFDVVYFDTKSPKLVKHLLQTGFTSALRSVQHKISKSSAKIKAKETKVVSKIKIKTTTMSMNGSEIDLKNLGLVTEQGATSNRISVTGYTTNDATATLTTAIN